MGSQNTPASILSQLFLKDAVQYIPLSGWRWVGGCVVGLVENKAYLAFMLSLSSGLALVELGNNSTKLRT